MHLKVLFILATCTKTLSEMEAIISIELCSVISDELNRLLIFSMFFSTFVVILQKTVDFEKMRAISVFNDCRIETYIYQVYSIFSFNSYNVNQGDEYK